MRHFSDEDDFDGYNYYYDDDNDHDDNVFNYLPPYRHLRVTLVTGKKRKRMNCKHV